MDKFGPETKVRLECKKCDVKEIITLGDLPATPNGSFITLHTVQCIRCLSVISIEVHDEDQG